MPYKKPPSGAKHNRPDSSKCSKESRPRGRGGRVKSSRSSQEGTHSSNDDDGSRVLSASDERREGSVSRSQTGSRQAKSQNGDEQPQVSSNSRSRGSSGVDINHRSTGRRVAAAGLQGKKSEERRWGWKWRYAEIRPKANSRRRRVGGWLDRSERLKWPPQYYVG